MAQIDSMVSRQILESRAAGLPPDCDEEALDLLRNKAVVVVGPAKTLEGSRSGDVIDSYDLVVRFNTSFLHMPFPDRLAADIGARTDLLYCNSVVLARHVLGSRSSVPRGRIRDLARRRKRRRLADRFVTACAGGPIRQIICTNNDLGYALDGTPTHRCGEEFETTIPDLRTLILEHQIEASVRVLYQTPKILTGWLDGHLPTTGFVALLDLLLHPIRRLHVTGMTLFHSGGHQFQRRQSLSASATAGPHGHQPQRELALFRSYMSQFGDILSIDSHLRALISS